MVKFNYIIHSMKIDYKIDQILVKFRNDQINMIKVSEMYFRCPGVIRLTLCPLVPTSSNLIQAIYLTLGQTVKDPDLLLEEQSDLVLYCLPFHLHLFDKIP